MIKWLNNDAKVSYSQSGEDLIVDFIFQAVKISNPSYLDIGTHHSSHINNTYYFYKKGCKGVCVEPDPTLFSEILRNRSRDVCLNFGIAAGEQRFASFYVMTTRSLNTFSEEEALRCQETKNFGNQKIEQVINIPLLNVNEVMEKYFSDGVNFISIDVEGLDFEIVSSFNFEKYQPDVFCVETLRYQDDGMLKKNSDIIQYLLGKGYFLYADTYMNTVFISNKMKLLLKAS